MDEELNGQQAQESAEGAGNEATEQVQEEVQEEQRIKLGEREVLLKDAIRAWNDYGNDTSWKSKNTQEAQRISAERGQLEKARALEEYLSRHPEKFEKIREMFQEPEATGGKLPPELNGVMERIKQAEFNVSVQAAEMRLKNQLVDLRTQHKDMFDADKELESKIIECARNNEFRDLKTAYKMVTYDSLFERGIKQGLEKATAARKRSTELGNAAPGGSPMAKDLRAKLKGKSFDSPEMIEALMNHPAMQELGD